MKEYSYVIRGDSSHPGRLPARGDSSTGDLAKGQVRTPKVGGVSALELDPKYSGTLYHLDTWRLSDPKELESTLHLSTLLKPGNIVVIEWAGKASEILKTYESIVPILVIDIKEKDVDSRQITYAFYTPEWS